LAAIFHLIIYDRFGRCDNRATNFIETSVFTRHIVDLLDDTDYTILQRALLLNPALGDIIPGSGGIRKLRWAAKGHGKSGGARVIYYWAVSVETILLLDAYPKNVKADLTKDELKKLRRIVEKEYP
jgi:mRNA-degrading endonuclease RelE of RelBE toxin-antitoxin system